MKQTLSQSQMLEIWKRNRMVEPLRLDCTVQRTDGPDVDAMLIEEMRSWYLNLLDFGPESAIIPCDVTETCTVESLDHGNAVITAPEGCRRILSVWFAGWDFPLKVTDSPTPADSNPYCRRPAAYRLAPDRIAVSGTSGNLREVKCALDVSPQIYIFDDSALKIISN